MRRAFTRWLSGDPPAIAGAWLDQSGVCLVVMDWSDGSPRLAQVIYEPGGQFAVRVNDEACFNSAEVTNALRCAYEKLGSGSYALALGIPSADIFIKTIEIPTGLDDLQIAQLSVVEAVSNLPVPPEEVCSDFLRRSLDTQSNHEQVDLAFCKRDVIDTLRLLAEDADIALAVVDRDIQAIHDAALWCLAAQHGLANVQYPLGLLLLGEDARLVIGRSALDLTSYELHSDPGQHSEEALRAILEALKLYCRRAGLTDGPHGYLKQLLVSGHGAAAAAEIFDRERVAERVDEIDLRLLAGMAGNGVPLNGLMVATGMALRRSA